MKSILIMQVYFQNFYIPTSLCNSIENFYYNSYYFIYAGDKPNKYSI